MGFIEPKDLGLAVIVHAIVFLVICRSIVPIRIVVHMRNKCKGWDDFLMCIGLWEPEDGKVLDPVYIMSFAYVLSGVSIITDLMIAAMPAVILWRLQRGRFFRNYLIVILALSAVASVVTIVRLRFLLDYTSSTGSYGRAAMTICTIVEVGVGIAGGSTAALKPLLEKLWKRRVAAAQQPPIPLQARSTTNLLPPGGKKHEGMWASGDYHDLELVFDAIDRSASKTSLQTPEMKTQDV